MSRRHPYENRYCNHCRMTTRHEVKANEYGCLRCGSVKYPANPKPRPKPEPVAA